jgi:hypothetical protein
MATQIGNRAERDVIGRDRVEKHYHIAPATPLSRLYQILRDEDKAASYTAQITDTLLHYCAGQSADVRGLEEKLAASGRTDLLAEAAELKQRAAKLIMRWQTSPVTQDIITHVLAKIHQAFMFYVRPAIEAGASRADIDELIAERVIEPTSTMLGDNDLGITMIDIAGLLFFLGGNCHVRWDKC